MVARDGEFKLVIDFSEKRDYLYDLKNDPGENSPLAPGVRTGERARLLQLAYEHLQRTGDRQKTDLRLRALLRELQQSARMNGGAPDSSILSEKPWISIPAGGVQN